jgi:hypothetical protein
MKDIDIIILKKMALIHEDISRDLEALYAGVPNIAE